MPVGMRKVDERGVPTIVPPSSMATNRSVAGEATISPSSAVDGGGFDRESWGDQALDGVDDGGRERGGDLDLHARPYRYAGGASLGAVRRAPAGAAAGRRSGPTGG